MLTDDALPFYGGASPAGLMRRRTGDVNHRLPQSSAAISIRVNSSLIAAMDLPPCRSSQVIGGRAIARDVSEQERRSCGVKILRATDTRTCKCRVYEMPRDLSRAQTAFR